MHFVPAYLVAALYAVGGMAVALPAPAPEAAPEPVSKPLDRQIFAHPSESSLTTNLATHRSGRGTIYEQGGAYGSCGWKHGDYDLIAALSTYYMPHHKAPNCGRMVRARNTQNGNTLLVKVADTCAGCGRDDIDFSVGAWNKLTNNAPWGVFPASWQFV